MRIFRSFIPTFEVCSENGKNNRLHFPQESFSKVDECWDFSSRVWIIHSRGKLFCHPKGDLCFNHFSRFCVIFPFVGDSLICFGFHLIFVCWPSFLPYVVLSPLFFSFSLSDVLLFWDYYLVHRIRNPFL